MALIWFHIPYEMTIFLPDSSIFATRLVWFTSQCHEGVDGVQLIFQFLAAGPRPVVAPGNPSSFNETWRVFPSTYGGWLRKPAPVGRLFFPIIQSFAAFHGYLRVPNW